MITYREAVGSVLKDERLAQNRTLRDVSESSFTALGYLSEVERGQKEASSEVVAQLARALNLEAGEVVIRAGLRMLSDGVPDTVEELLDKQERLAVR